MEYHVQLHTPLADLATLSDQLQGHDPAAVVDVDTGGRNLRISTCLGQVELALQLRQAGLRVDAAALVLQPSVCCGGCSG